MTATLRKPAVAGVFYPSSASDLEKWVGELVAGDADQEDLVACIAPHAGYRYSGAVAGKTFGHLRIPRKVVVMGPNHTGMGPAVAIAPHEAWDTPLGSCSLDRDLITLILEEYPDAELDSSAHWREHSIEVMLPFLLARQPELTIVPICLKHLSLDRCVALGEALARVAARVDEPVGVVASSDMTHYEPDDRARQRDRLAIDAALTLDPASLYNTVHTEGITMCGVIPATAAMVAANSMGARRGHLVSYATSGDSSGDRSSVVGYAGICFAREQ